MRNALDFILGCIMLLLVVLSVPISILLFLMGPILWPFILAGWVVVALVAGAYNRG